MLHGGGVGRRFFSTVSEVRAASLDVRAVVALAAAFSPAPDKPPLYIDLPLGMAFFGRECSRNG